MVWKPPGAYIACRFGKAGYKLLEIIIIIISHPASTRGKASPDLQ